MLVVFIEDRVGKRGLGISAKRQFWVFYSGEQPVGVALLADDLVAKRIDAGDTRLTAVEWKSGANLRIIDIIALFGGEAGIREQTREIVHSNGK
jgi:cytolysin-activating lysine-acyltransferase